MGNTCTGVDKDMQPPVRVAPTWTETGPILNLLNKNVQLAYPGIFDDKDVTLGDLLNNKENQKRLGKVLCADLFTGCVPDGPANTLADLLLDVAGCQFTFAEAPVDQRTLSVQGIMDESIIYMEKMNIKHMGRLRLCSNFSREKLDESTHAMTEWCLKPEVFQPNRFDDDVTGAWVSQSLICCDAGPVMCFC